MSQRGPNDDRWPWKRDAKGREYRIDEKTNETIFRQDRIPRTIPIVPPKNLKSAATSSGYYGSTSSAGTIQQSSSPASSPSYTYNGASPTYPGADHLSSSFKQLSLDGFGSSRGKLPVNQATANPGSVQIEKSNAAGTKVVATPSQRKILNEDYQVRKHPAKYFQIGKVFLTVHNEAYGESGKPQQKLPTAETTNPDVFVVSYGTLAFSKVRRFVVVREGINSCTALAISTHSGKGAARNDGIDHGVVYTGLQPPAAYNYEKDIFPIAIRVDALRPADRLNRMSRLNYSKLYTIEHNVRVKPYGIVNNKFMHVLIQQFTVAFFRKSTTSMTTAINRPSRQNLQALGFNDKQMNAILTMIVERKAEHSTAISAVALESAKQIFHGREKQQDLAKYALNLLMAGMTFQQAIERVNLVEEKETSAGVNDDKAFHEEDEAEEDDDGDDDDSDDDDE